MIRNTDGSERLYLSKGDQTIYIDNCKIPQHHIDGIRFLYRQYNKKKSGVIINDTSGYGRNLQIVLFLKAVRHLFDKPVLVLCHEGTEHDWVEQFQTWTDLCDDVVLEIEKPFVKKLVLINTMSNLAAFSRREWSVVVMDGDKCSQQVLKLPFKADYKIWVTPFNMRENLDKFSQIYKWLYPKDTFDKAKFTANVKDPLDVVQKAVLLDVFMEDIVAKTNEQDTSRDSETNEKDRTPPRRISRKNKDATGTKIKRSKRKIYDDDDDDVPLSKTKKENANAGAASNNSTTVCNEDYENAISDNFEPTEDFSIDNFKRKSIEEFDEDLLGEKEESNTSNNQSEMNLYYEPDTVTEENSDRLYEMDTLVFSDNTCNDQSTNVNDIVEPTDNKEAEQSREIKGTDLNKDDDTPSDPEIESRNSTPVKMCRSSPIDRSKTENDNATNEIFETKNGTVDIGDRGSPSIFTMEEDVDENSQSESIIDGIKSDIKDLESSKNESVECNEIKSEHNTKHEEPPISDELTPDINKDITLNEVQNNSKVNEVTNVNKSVINEVSPVTKKHNCMEEKIKEMEERALKKFKGSILDSLF